MSNQMKIGRNISIVLVGNIISYLLGFIYFSYTARYFGVLNFGILSFAIATTSILAIFVNCGMDQLFIREVARNKSVISEIIGNSLIIKLALGFITFILLTIYLKLLHYETETLIVIYIMFISTIISSIKGVFDSIFQALEKPIFTSISNILNIIILLFGIYIAIDLKWDLIQFSILYPVTNFIILLFFVCLIKKDVKVQYWWKINIKYIMWILKNSWSFAITSLFVSIYVWTDSIMLSIFKGEMEVGYYNAAYRMVLALLFIPIAFNIAIFPVLSRQYTESKKSVNIIINKYFSIMVAMGISIAVGTTILAEEFIEIIYGEDYLPAVVVLQILIWSLAFTYMNAPFVKLFESINMQLAVTKITGASAVINVLINYLLIPKYSMVGASIATLFTEALVAVSLILYSIKLGYFKLEYIKILKIMLGCLTLGVFLFFQDNLNVFITIACSVLLYSGVLYILKVIDKEDISLIRSVLRLG